MPENCLSVPKVQPYPMLFGREWGFCTTARQSLRFQGQSNSISSYKTERQIPHQSGSILSAAVYQFRNFFAVKGNFSACSLIHPSQKVKQRCLACAGRTQQNIEFPLIDMKSHPGEGMIIFALAARRSRFGGRNFFDGSANIV